MMVSRARNMLQTLRCLHDPFLGSVAFTKRRLMDEPTRDAKDSPGLVQLVTKEEQLSWAEKIKPHFPHCITMYNNLLQHGHGHVSHDTFYVLHGHPSSHAIVCDKKIAPTVLHAGVFCQEEDVDHLIEALASTSIINWHSANVVIHHIPPYLVSAMQGLAKQKGVKMDVSVCMAYTYDPRLDPHPLRLGEGLRMCRLGKAGVRRLFEGAEYKEGMPLELLYSLAQRLPYLGVYRDEATTQDTIVDVVNLPVAGDEEVPISWSCSTPSGEVGKTGTEDGFRRRGLASLTGTAVARQQAALLGFIPHAFYDPQNFVAIEMVQKQPGFRYTHDAFWMSNVKPEEK